MRVLHWCMLGVTILLLVCEVAVNQLCKSLIILLDGFHTFFLFVCMVMPPPQPAGVTEPLLSSLGSSAPPLHTSSSPAALPPSLDAESPIKPLPGTQSAIDGSPIPDQPCTHQRNLEAAPQVHSHQLCGRSYSSSRAQAVGAFVSALTLVSLCSSYVIEIINFSLEPQLAQRPLLLVAVGAVSLLYKMLVLWLNWDELVDEQAGAGRQREARSHLEVNHEVLAEAAEPGRVPDDVSQVVQCAVDDPLHNGALVLSNPGTSSSLPDSQTPQPQPEVIAQISKCSMGHLDSQGASNTCKSSRHVESSVPRSQWSVSLLSFVLVTQGLCTSILALINSLVMLLMSPQGLHSSGARSLLLYLDPGLSLLAVITLIATASPQVHRYGLLLLQATPPHVCVSDLGRRIASVPGVQAVHDLHVWQLNKSSMVASVHVHCKAGFPAHRFADLLSGVTKVLQSVGVSCCTVQPEFASCSGFSAGGGADISPVVHREDPSLPPLMACSLACGKACAGNMCCSPLEEETKSLLAPPAGETEKREEPHALVIENTFREVLTKE